MDNDSTKVDVTIIPIECGTNSLKIGLKYYYGPRKPPVEATCYNCPTCIAVNRRGGSTLMEILIPTFYELPKVLIFHILRFKIAEDGNYKKNKKVQKVNFFLFGAKKVQAQEDAHNLGSFIEENPDGVIPDYELVGIVVCYAVYYPTNIFLASFWGN